MTERVSYGEIARLFLRMSVSAFGGPAAHLAMGEDEIVTRRRWLTREHYLDLIAATNLIPGPNSTETMIHVGYVLRGIPGAVLAGACFITPAFLITLALTAVYVAGGALPGVNDALWGIQPVIVAIIGVAAYRLAPAALKKPSDWALLALAMAAIALLDVPEVVVMLATGAAFVLLQRIALPGAALIGALPLALMQAGQAVEAAAKAGAGDLFWYFLRIGSVLFGSGYVLVSYIEQDLVNTLGWLTTRQLLDAVAIGQFTPGPVLTTAGSVGYIVAGVPGAVLATIGVFLPAFVLVIVTAPLIPRMRQIPALAAFLSGVNIGVIAAMALTVIRLALAAAASVSGSGAFDLSSVLALLLAVGALVGLVRFKVNATWLIAIGAAIGLGLGALI